jgi:uncharacterized Fe-S cluster-containing protein
MQTTSIAENDWIPPGKNCGACGLNSCDDFSKALKEGRANHYLCPFFTTNNMASDINIIPRYTGYDVVGQKYSFVLRPMPGEISARKIVLPFRSDLVEKWDIKEGDIVVGRPAGAGCPVQHVLRVIEADEVTGAITGHVVGPAFSRGKEVKDVKCYHMLGFEGGVLPISGEPQFGMRYHFLPGFCMLDRAHTGLVNTVIKKPWGLQIRIENILIL